MRTKALLALAALAIAIPASAQVYSANIVGYVNVTLAGNQALTLLANPLKPSDGNYNVTNTLALPNSWDGAALYKWLGTDWDPNPPGYIADFGWYPDAEIALGESFFVQAPVSVADTTVTFVGEVQTGTVASTLNPGVTYAANKFPIAQAWPGAAVGNDGDAIYIWTGSTWSDTEVWGYIADFGWFASDPEATNGPVIPVGGGVAYENKGVAINFNQTFNP